MNYNCNGLQIGVMRDHCRRMYDLFQSSSNKLGVRVDGVEA